MMTTRFAPFRDLDLVGRPRLVPAPAAPGVPFDAVRTEDALELTFDLPGYDAERIDLSVARGVLTLSAERSWVPAEDAKVLVAERRHGAIRRQLRLADSLDASKVEARFDNGVLSVKIPVSTTAQAQKVDITVGASPLVDSTAIESAEGDEASTN